MGTCAAHPSHGKLSVSSSSAMGTWQCQLGGVTTRVTSGAAGASSGSKHSSIGPSGSELVPRIWSDVPVTRHSLLEKVQQKQVLLVWHSINTWWCGMASKCTCGHDAMLCGVAGVRDSCGGCRWAMSEYYQGHKCDQTPRRGVDLP